MKVICKENTSGNLDLKEVTTVFTYQHNYGLIIEKEYIVMGIAIYKDTNCLYYLIDENQRPWWMPYPLFAISDNSFPAHWYISVFDKKNTPGSACTLMGFDELCNQEDFHDLLIEQNSHALDVYFARKHQFENDECKFHCIC